MITYSGTMRPSVVRVRVISFGSLRSCLPEGGAVREVVAGSRVGELLEALVREGGVAEETLRGTAVAVNQEYVGRDRVLAEGDEVALLPPVSGGREAAVGDDARVRLTREAINVQALSRQLAAGPDGAIVVFDGVVRDNTRGRRTLYLDYEAYEEMALKQMQLLRKEAIEHYGARDAAIVHRLGRIGIGESSVVIVVVSAHRAQAFAAARFVIDMLKKTVPIWKKEQFADGAVWADGEPFPDEVLGASQ